MLLAAVSMLAVQELPLTQFVNPLIGTVLCGNYGCGWDAANIFPGAACLRGTVAWSSDTTHANRISGGYWYPDHAIEDFSRTDISGRGVINLTDATFMLVVQPVSVSPGNDWSGFAARFSHTNENAAAGYYCVKLDDCIKKRELTATLHTGMARFSFPDHIPAAVLIRPTGQYLSPETRTTRSSPQHLSSARGNSTPEARWRRCPMVPL